MNRAALFHYVREHYPTEPEYIWQHLPDYAVLRHQKGNKWFALVMKVPGTRLGLSSGEDIDILELKISLSILALCGIKREFFLPIT